MSRPAPLSTVQTPACREKVAAARSSHDVLYTSYHRQMGLIEKGVGALPILRKVKLVYIYFVMPHHSNFFLYRIRRWPLRFFGIPSILALPTLPSLPRRWLRADGHRS